MSDFLAFHTFLTNGTGSELIQSDMKSFLSGDPCSFICSSMQIEFWWLVAGFFQSTWRKHYYYLKSSQGCFVFIIPIIHLHLLAAVPSIISVATCRNCSKPSSLNSGSPLQSVGYSSSDSGSLANAWRRVECLVLLSIARFSLPVLKKHGP